jgi:hypothetical protein
VAVHLALAIFHMRLRSIGIWVAVGASAACVRQAAPPSAVSVGRSGHGPTTPATIAATVAVAHVRPVEPSRCAGPHISDAGRGALRVYIVRDPRIVDSSLAGEAPRSRICAESAGAPAQVIVEGRAASRPEAALVALDNLVLSADGRTVYFSSQAWATSRAAHAVDLDGSNLRFLTDGVVVEELAEGPYVGKLLAVHSRLDDAHPFTSVAYRGRVDVFTLLTPNGKLFMRLPEDQAKHAALLCPKVVKQKR